MIFIKKRKFLLTILFIIASFKIAITQNIINKFNSKFEYYYRNADDKDSLYKPVNSNIIEISYKIVSGRGDADNPYKVSVLVKNKLDKPWKGVIRFDLKKEDTNARFFMPAFIYGRNRGEKAKLPNSKLFPRIKRGKVSIPFSSYWMVRSDRLSHAVSIMYVDKTVFAISSNPYNITTNNIIKGWEPMTKGTFHSFNGFACSLDNYSTVSYTLGYENAPVLYVDAQIISKRKQLNDNCFILEPQQSYSFDLYIYAFKAEDERAISNVTENIYNQYHQLPRKVGGLKQSVNDMSRAIYNDAYIPSIKNYATQVYLKDNKIITNPMASISWTGGVEIATPLLMASIRLNDVNMHKQALECIQNIVDNSLNPKSGLPFDAYEDGKWTTKGWWNGDLSGKEGHASYLVGQCLYYILKAYDYEKKYKNTEHADWLNFVHNALESMKNTINSENEFPYLWSSEDGKGIEYDSFSGCWCLASMAYYMKITGNKNYLQLCKKSEEHYYNKFLKHMECYGTPLDTYKAVDSEGILAYIKAVKWLHEITGETIFLDHLKDAMDYEFTFKFCYNVPIQVPPLSKVGWSSCGGSVTSTSNPHIHPMSSNVSDELLYLYKKTGNEYFNKRLNDVMLWGMQTYNTFDNEYDFGKKGWMSERFCFSEGLLTEKYPDGKPSSTWFCMLPWGEANIIEGMCGDIWNNYNEQ